MKAPSPISPSLDELKSLYRALHEDTKKDICAVLYKIDPTRFEKWFMSARIRGGYTHAATVVKRPLGTSKPLDEALLQQKDFFVGVIGDYVLHHEREGCFAVLLERLASIGIKNLNDETYSHVIGAIPMEAVKHPNPPPDWMKFVQTYFHADSEWIRRVAEKSEEQINAVAQDTPRPVADAVNDEPVDASASKDVQDYRHA